MIGWLRRRLSRPAGFAGWRPPTLVGVCDICDGPLVLSAERDEAVCPCGASRVPREFMEGA